MEIRKQPGGHLCRDTGSENGEALAVDMYAEPQHNTDITTDTETQTLHPLTDPSQIYRLFKVPH